MWGSVECGAVWGDVGPFFTSAVLGKICPLDLQLSHRMYHNNLNPPPMNAIPTCRSEAPVEVALWVDDDDAKKCMCCRECEFSFFHRRHHCRQCGRVVCNGYATFTTRSFDFLSHI